MWIPVNRPGLSPRRPVVPRFVLLEHRWIGVHWDFLLERGEVLQSWAIDAPIVTGQDQPARRLPDHRLAYLDYEGPISAGRGEVTRVARGTYEVREWSEDRLKLTILSPQLSGSAMLSREGGGAWSFRFEGNVD